VNLVDKQIEFTQVVSLFLPVAVQASVEQGLGG
jgi:hypothetical protein